MTEQMKATLNSLCKDILTVPLDASRARMYVLMNGIDYKEGEDLPTQSRTVLYTINNPDGLNYNQIEDCEVLDDGTGTADQPNPKNPVQKPDILKRILKGKISVDTKQEQVFFITWDHGSAFGIFREAEEVKAERRTPIYQDLGRYPYLAAFWNSVGKKYPQFVMFLNQLNKSPFVVQVHHSFYKAVRESETQDFSASTLR